MELNLPIFTSQGRAPPKREERGRRLIDSHGRTIRDLRLSVTDRCNFRCTYCMEPDIRFLRKTELMSVPEMVRVARLCVGLGVEKIRLTGGEPTVYAHLDELIGELARLPIKDLAMTTNGSLMDLDRAREWKRLGLRRVTLSLDTLRPDRFAAITRSKTPPQRVIDAIQIAKEVGLEPVRVNAVIVRGWNDDEILDLVALARDIGFELRFIEYMPLDSARAWDRKKLVSADEILEIIQSRFDLTPVGRDGHSGTSLNHAFGDGSPGGVGIIASVTRIFCGACSRLRITADAQVRPCLFSAKEFDLRVPLRHGVSDTELEDFLLDSVWTKQPQHGINEAGFEQPDRPMSAIGG